MFINTIKNLIFEFRYNLGHKNANKPTFSDHSEYTAETISLKNARKLWLPEYSGPKKNADANDSLYGAMFGDMAGSRYEFYQYPKDYDTMDLLDDRSFYTDDTILSIATQYAIKNNLWYDEAYHQVGNVFRYAGYGPGFSHWLSLEEYKPYYSFGNGSAMRISYIGSYFSDKNEMFQNAYDSASATHNHIEGIKGAVVVASCIWILYQGGSKEDVYQYARKCYPEIDKYQMDNIRYHEFVNVDCMVCVPLAIQCFLESDSIESCMRNVLSFSGDADTIGAIACSIAASYYGFAETEEKYKKRILEEYEEICGQLNF